MTIKKTVAIKRALVSVFDKSGLEILAKFLDLEIFDQKFKLVNPTRALQIKSVNKAIKNVKMGNVKEAAKAIRLAINYLIKMKCKKIILGCTELPIAIFAFKSLKKSKLSKVFIDPNLLLAEIAMKKYKS